jgi:hypothetical protein
MSGDHNASTRQHHQGTGEGRKHDCYTGQFMLLPPCRTARAIYFLFGRSRIS